MSKQFIPFDLERFMSIWENQVDYNLSESGVHPLTMRELVQDPKVLDEILNTTLGYPQTNGSIELREKISAIYPGTTIDNVLVTTGAAQANFTSLWTLLAPGDEVAIMLPNYMQIWGIAQNLGMKVNTFSLKEENGWALDIDELNRAVTPNTKLIAVCNPDNPTGHIFTPAEMDAVVAAARRAGAWLLADEVYAGSEREGDSVTPSFWGRYEKVLAIGSMSKAYGLPGLRVGWVVSPAPTSQELWARQDYITIGTGMIDNKLAAYALSPDVRPRLLQRTRDYVRQGYQNFEDWASQHPGVFSWVPPQAAAIVFLRYHTPLNSSQLIENLIQVKRTYFVPGDHFGLDGHIRVSFGLSRQQLEEGLNRLNTLLQNA